VYLTLFYHGGKQKMTAKKVCYKCGASDYTDKLFVDNLYRWCNKCGARMGYVPSQMMADLKETRWPMGPDKYFNKYLREIPIDFLRWARDNIELRAGLKAAVEYALSENLASMAGNKQGVNNP
jgi:hypothetical protein